MEISTGGGDVVRMSSDSHGLGPCVNIRDLLLKSSFDGHLYLFSDPFFTSEVCIVDPSQRLLVPLAHGVCDHVVGSDYFVSGR